MSIPVIDACVAIKWFLPEEGHEQAGAILRSYNNMLVPDLFWIEFDAIVTKKVRQGLVEKEDAGRIATEIRNLPFHEIPYRMISGMAFDLSAALPVTQYDACYLAVALECNEQVHTADRRFVRGMKGTPFENMVRAI